jgi:predicted tellurium resistance membrane protein TerC
MSEFLTSEALSALFQVIFIDLVLAGDNAIVIGLAAAGLPKNQRNKAILIGIIAATILRIGFAAITTQLLQVVGLLLVGGVLLLWVCWKCGGNCAPAIARSWTAFSKATPSTPTATARPALSAKLSPRLHG